MKNKILWFRILQIALLALYIGLLVFYTLKSLENGAQSTESSNKVTDITADVITTITQKPVEKTEDFKSFVRKFIGHYSYFVTLGTVSVFLYLTLRKLKPHYRFIIHFSTGFIYAIMTEFWFQKVAGTRGPNWNDVGLDYLGFITISIFVLMIYYIIYFTKRRKKLIYIKSIQN